MRMRSASAQEEVKEWNRGLRSDGDSATRVELLGKKSTGDGEEDVGDEEHGQSNGVFLVVAIENTFFKSLCRFGRKESQLVKRGSQ